MMMACSSNRLYISLVAGYMVCTNVHYILDIMCNMYILVQSRTVNTQYL